MKNIYKPMLYSTPMVQGLLEDRKNQTRRTKGLEKINENPDLWKHDGITIFGKKDGFISEIFQTFLNIDSGEKLHILCPYKIGEILWVRERFTEWPKGEFQYYANTALGDELGKWKPSIHMPKAAARIFLEITEVRVERLKDIDHWSAEKEGVEMRLIDGFEEFRDYMAKGQNEDEPWGETYYSDPTPSFYSLWESINGKESLDLNLFVWVIKFQRIEKPLDFC